MGLVNVDLNNIRLDDQNLDDEYDPEIIIPVRLMAWCNRYDQRKACKKEISKELIPVGWRIWLDWCIPEDEKKKVEPCLIDKKQCNAGKMLVKVV